MTIETEATTLDEDPNSLYRIQKIKFSSSKSILTPAKTIPLDQTRLKDTLNPDSRQLNEIFKRFTSDKIKEASEDNEKYSELERWFNSQKNKIQDKTSTFCFIDFNESRLPTEEEIDFMTELAYCNSDITTIPTVNHFNKSKQPEIGYEDYKNYLNTAIETIEQLNNKPIMGIIPKLAPKKVAGLIDFYQSKGINAYAMDLGGSNPISSSMRLFKVLKTLNKTDSLETSYIHGHNVGMRVNKTTDVIPAKDVLGFGVGLGSLGEKRTVFKPNRAFLDIIKTNPMNKFRLFDKEDYGYWKSISVEELQNVYPDDCGLPLDYFGKKSQMSSMQKTFNAEQLALESCYLRKLIKETPEEPLDYIRSKQHVIIDDISVLEKGKQKTKK